MQRFKTSSVLARNSSNAMKLPRFVLQSAIASSRCPRNAIPCFHNTVYIRRCFLTRIYCFHIQSLADLISGHQFSCWDLILAKRKNQLSTLQFYDTHFVHAVNKMSIIKLQCFFKSLNGVSTRTPKVHPRLLALVANKGKIHHHGFQSILTT